MSIIALLLPIIFISCACIGLEINRVITVETCTCTHFIPIAKLISHSRRYEYKLLLNYTIFVVVYGSSDLVPP